MRMLLGAVGIFLALTGGGAGEARADEAERLGLARQIMALRSAEAEERYFQALLPYYMQSIAQSMSLTEGDRARLPDVLREEYQRAQVTAREHSAATYARIFTEEELRQILAFYESAAGRRFLASQVELSDDGINLQQAVNIAVLSAVAERLLAAREGRQF